MKGPTSDSELATLRERLTQTFSTNQRTVRSGTHAIHLTCPTGMDELLDELAARPATDADVADERLPYWAELWPSALALAGYIGSQESTLQDISAIELGCGLGLVGIAAGLQGARVLLTDYMPTALDFAAVNWRENLQTTPTVQRLDWREPDPDLKADLILAADVIYEKRAFTPVMRAFDSLLTSTGRILLAEPRRRLAREFFDQIEQSPFHIAFHHEAPDSIDIYELRRT